MINNVVLVGRLTKDPDLRYTPSGAAVARFSLAVNRSFKNQNGDYDADFINCVIWRQSAEALANFTRKGSLIGVTGRIQTGSYEKDGQRVYTTEVVAENFQMLESKNANQQRTQGTPSDTGSNQTQGYQQQNNQGFSQNPSTSSNQNDMPQFTREADPFGSASQIDISDDDLPF
ncbi:single-stranded DNA-binding protein [Vagococcus coleopterorum]|uniref:Single-stranded DNA-binding protein n=1 Tax=Vagococcus coleopterorum TaxID=2714946 RepID=A0A6G8ALQ2_9ENTE|nr:single-stranded DNA-binding protein [Vagococcus coleopterorum]QIL45988.1 single-stranded DNA-binding protein [Vagococcus coleopterorum]